MPYPNSEHDAYMKNIHYMRIKDSKEIDRVAHDPSLTSYDADHFLRNPAISNETVLFLYNKYYGAITAKEVEAFPARNRLTGEEKPDIMAFLSYHQLPAAVVEMWANSRDWYVIYNLLKQKSLSKETLNNLIFRDDDVEITRCYIEVPNLTEAQINRLADLDFGSHTYIDFFKQKNLSTETAWKIFRKGLDLEENFPLTLALKRNLPDGMLEELSEHGNPWVRRKVGLNPKTPVPVLEKLADDPELTVKIGVAKNPNVSAETLGYLHDIGSKQIQNSLDKNPTWQRHIGKY